MQWSVVYESEAVIVELAGELDVANAAALSHALTTIVLERPSTVTVDLTQLTFMDSSGIRCLMGAANLALDGGCNLTVRHPNATIRRVFEVCGVDQILLHGASEGPAATRR